jgi:hypothetical protein
MWCSISNKWKGNTGAKNSLFTTKTKKPKNSQEKELGKVMLQAHSNKTNLPIISCVLSIS